MLENKGEETEMAMKGQGSLSDYKFVISEFSNRERKEAVNYLVNYS